MLHFVLEARTIIKIIFDTFGLGSNSQESICAIVSEKKVKLDFVYYQIALYIIKNTF